MKPATPDMRRLSCRETLVSGDIETVVALTKTTGFFSEDELDIAEELVRERLEKGAKSGYFFLFVEIEDEMVGFTCYGPIPGTRSSFDLYWIVVAKSYQRLGIGRLLLANTESRIRQSGGTRIYVETSSRQQYESTRRFYHAHGYRQAALLEDFYSPGDGKHIYEKIV